MCVSDFQRKEFFQAMLSHGVEENKMGLFKCSLNQVYVGGPVWLKKGKEVQSEELIIWRAMLLRRKIFRENYKLGSNCLILLLKLDIFLELSILHVCLTCSHD